MIFNRTKHHCFLPLAFSSFTNTFNQPAVRRIDRIVVSENSSRIRYVIANDSPRSARIIVILSPHESGDYYFARVHRRFLVKLLDRSKPPRNIPRILEERLSREYSQRLEILAKQTAMCARTLYILINRRNSVEGRNGDILDA